MSRNIELTKLTKRETQIVQLIAQGYKRREAAETLGLTHSYINSCLQRIYSKLGFSGVAKLANYARDNSISN